MKDIKEYLKLPYNYIIQSINDESGSEIMDKNMTVEEVKNIAQKFYDDRDWGKFHNPKDLAISIEIEATELLEIFRFKNEDQVKEIMSGEKREKVEDEVGDILLNLLRFAQMNDIDLSEALISKIRKSEIKYPVSKVKGKNLKYNEY